MGWAPPPALASLPSRKLQAPPEGDRGDRRRDHSAPRRANLLLGSMVWLINEPELKKYPAREYFEKEELRGSASLK